MPGGQLNEICFNFSNLSLWYNTTRPLLIFPRADKLLKKPLAEGTHFFFFIIFCQDKEVTLICQQAGKRKKENIDNTKDIFSQK